MADYTLYCFGESGNCFKVALMLELCGLSWEPHFVDFFKGETRGEAYRGAVNEMGEAPVLEHQGQRLSQSGVILSWLAARTGRFGGKNEAERLEVLRWILFDNHKFTSYFGTLRFLVGLQKSGETPVTAFLRERVRSAYAIVDKHLAARQFLVGDDPTIADFSLAGYVYYREETGLDRSPYGNLNAWADRIAALPGWRHPYDLMPRALS